MKTEDTLNVWHDKTLVGVLEQNPAGVISFRYDENWVKAGFAISQDLPLQTAEYSSELGKAHRFFANLLPEADARMHIVRDLKISNSDFELLKAIGGECAGAFSILPANIEPNTSSRHEKLSDEQLKKILLRKGQVFSLSSSEDRPRLSLAGAQDKCPIFFDGKDFFLPKNSSPSTHILKFEILGYRNIPIYEYFLTKLAKSIGLPVVDMELRDNDQEYFLLIKRYDRILSAENHVKRLHQEDFCQALGVSYEKKYQLEGGPSFCDCYKLAQEIISSPMDTLENLLRWQIFNLLSGNSDGHAKNIALLYVSEREIQLAPFYDLVCTRAIERIDSRLAMSIGGEFDPDKIMPHHWEKLASECSIRSKYLKSLIQSMAVELPEKFNITFEEFEATFGPTPSLQRIKSVILKQCKKQGKGVAS